MDNASGVGTLLHLAERILSLPAGPTLEFIAFTNEEYYTSPDRDIYVQTALPTFGEIVATINIDGIGSAVGTNSLAIFNPSPAFETLVEDSRARFPGVTRVDPWPASNHFIFAFNGVPCLAFSNVGPNLIHTPNDTLAMTSPSKLNEIADLVSEIVGQLMDKAPAWTRAPQTV